MRQDFFLKKGANKIWLIVIGCGKEEVGGGEDRRGFGGRGKNKKKKWHLFFPFFVMRNLAHYL